MKKLSKCAFCWMFAAIFAIFGYLLFPKMFAEESLNFSVCDVPADRAAFADRFRCLEPVNASATVNLNTADAETLQSLDGIGPVLAARILAYRETYGCFVTLEEVKNVVGIGSEKFETIREQIATGEIIYLANGGRA